MDQLKGRVVNVVLTIQEGKGMESLKSLVFISANFNGRVLESDPVPAEDNPPFNTNLIWEIEKKDLRKIRSSNQPLKIDCVSLDPQNRREKFGHVLLDVRSAHVVEDSTQMVPFRWYKLIGVRHRKRNACPEIYVSLTIRNHLANPNVEVPDEVIAPEPRVDCKIPIQYLEDGYIMVGEKEKSNEDFSLNLLVKSAVNLDLLLPEVLVFHQNKHKYFMCIKIFGVPISTKQFSKDLHDKIIFEEKIVVRLLSSLETLQEFFREEQIEVGFNCSNDVLGTTKINLDGVTNINEKLILSNCFFRFPSANGIVPVNNSRKPSLSLEVFLIKNRDMDLSLVARPETEEASGDHVKAKEDLVMVTEDNLQEFEDWKEKRKQEFEEQLQKIKEEELRKGHEEILKKTEELDENTKKCRELQDELQEKLEDLRVSKALKKKNKSSINLLEVLEENQKKFGDCEKDLLIEYISKLQRDNENLKTLISEQKQVMDNVQKTALTREQTANLLQELKGLEEKFEAAQQSKSYFKEQWMRACQEIHQLKAEDYKQLQDQLRERREELQQIVSF